MMTREIALEDAQLLRRAAGSQSIETLQELIEQAAWTAKELDAMSVEGKTPLQQATWKGRLHSIQYLLDVVRCDVNVYTQQKFSHGKTAIFFALTQSRKDMVEYLLSRKDINVSIVNNKGQSVMSLAASHNMPTETLQQIQALEETDKEKWWNFRVTHSDGYEYGDL
jgi:ankyrin repeat protein